MRFPTLKPNPDNWRVDFIEDDFRNRVWEKGTQVSWSQACDCPCGTVSTVAGRTAAVRDFPVNCPLCKGRGKVYTEPQDIIVLMTASSSSEEIYNVWGEYASGTTFFSFLPENLPSEWDKIVLKEGNRLYSESRIRKGVGYNDAQRYAITKRKIICGSESDPYSKQELELGVTLCYRGDSLGLANSTPLVENVDFTVTEDGLIDWSLGDDLGTAPLPGERYALRYFCRPTFIIRDFPYIKRDFYETIKGELVFQNYPVKVLAILEHLGTFTAPHAPPDTGP